LKRSFQIKALDASLFDHLFTMSDEELKNHGAVRILVDKCPSFPCRVTLEDASVGETVLALSYLHLDVNSPYKASGPIFVRPNQPTVQLKINEIPPVLKHAHRSFSLRGYDENGMLIAARIASHTEVKDEITNIFDDLNVKYIQIHNTAPGCYACTAIPV